MNTPARLSVFTAGLVAVFAAAAVAGGALDPDAGVDASAPAGHAMSEQPTQPGGHGANAAPHGDVAAGGQAEAGHAEAGHAEAQPVRGLAVADGELALELATTTARAGARGELVFRIRDGHDARTAFDLEHDRRMHVIVVRRDLSGFQHLHPTMSADGTWRTPLTLAEPGTYRVFADFATDGEAHTLAADLTADGTVDTRPLPEPALSSTAEPGGLRVELTPTDPHAGDAAELAFRVTRDGRPVTLQRYLGAQGHLVALREGDLAFLHVHPEEGRLAFAAEFPSAGRYRLFLQFKTGGVVRTAAFTQEVAP